MKTIKNVKELKQYIEHDVKHSVKLFGFKLQSPLSKLLKTWGPLLIGYALIQTFMLSIGWVPLNGFTDPDHWLPLKKWPDWYLCLLGGIGVFIWVKTIIDNKINKGEL